MDLQFLGGAGEIGRSALLVNDSLLVDYGMLTADPPQYPVGDVDPDAVVVSHGHLDHVGALPSLLSGSARPPIHLTPPTLRLARILGRDTLKLHGSTPRCPFTEEELKRLTQVAETHGYREPFEAAGHEVTLFDAGHIPGSAHVLISEREGHSGNRTESDDDGGTRLLYTGDFHVDDRRDGERVGQRLLAGSTARPEADVVVTESTYADVRHDPRDAVEERFVESVKTTLWEGGTVVVPAFAIGRTQELMLVCAAHDIPTFVDGMGTEVTDAFLDHPEFLRDGDALRRARGHARIVSGRDGRRERIARENAAIVTTSGMLSGGPVVRYVPEIRGSPTNKIALTGYQVAGTPGRELLETGRAEFDGRVLPVSARVEQYDFSAHADADGLRRFLDAYRDARVLVTHGDRCEWFADQLRADGVDADAPAVGETYTV
jgi:putative mRNA 3-end processing factor